LIEIIDAPGAPAKVECGSRSYNHIEVQWRKPSDDGGAPVKGESFFDFLF
jgi:hypothetical protein